MEHEFKIKQGSFEIVKKENQKYWIYIILIFILVEIVTYIILSVFNIPKEPGFRKQSIILFSALIFIFLLNIWQSKSLNSIFRTYKLLLSSDLITRIQEGKAPLSISFDDVMQITKNKDGYFTIKGKDKKQIIYISKYIENCTKVEILLKKIKPITNI